MSESTPKFFSESGRTLYDNEFTWADESLKKQFESSLDKFAELVHRIYPNEALNIINSVAIYIQESLFGNFVQHVYDNIKKEAAGKLERIRVVIDNIESNNFNNLTDIFLVLEMLKMYEYNMGLESLKLKNVSNYKIKDLNNLLVKIDAIFNNDIVYKNIKNKLEEIDLTSPLNQENKDNVNDVISCIKPWFFDHYFLYLIYLFLLSVVNNDLKNNTNSKANNLRKSIDILKIFFIFMGKDIEQQQQQQQKLQEELTKCNDEKQNLQEKLTECNDEKQKLQQQLQQKQQKKSMFQFWGSKKNKKGGFRNLKTLKNKKMNKKKSLKKKSFKNKSNKKNKSNGNKSNGNKSRGNKSSRKKTLKKFKKNSFKKTKKQKLN